MKTKSVKVSLQNVLTVLFFIVLIAELAFLVYMNFTHMANMVDYDSSGAFDHAVVVWKQKTLFPTDYRYATTMDVDSIVWLVALFYGLTGNVLIAQAMGNCFIIAVYAYVLYCIFRSAKISNLFKIIGEIVFFIPYSFYQLGYISLLFQNSACNSVRYLIPILMISVLLEIQNKRKLRFYVLRLLYLISCVFLAGLSSGLYTILCAVFPMLVAEILIGLLNGDIRTILNRRTTFSVSMFMVGVLGFLTGQHMGWVSKASKQHLVSSKNMVNNMLKSFGAIYELLGGSMARDDIGLMSLDSISIILNWIFTTIVLVCVLYCLISLIKKRKSELLIIYCLAVFVINNFVLIMLDTTYGSDTFEFRYHIMPMFCALLIFVKCMQDIYTKYYQNNLLATVEIPEDGIWAKNQNSNTLPQVFIYCAMAAIAMMTVLSCKRYGESLNDDTATVDTLYAISQDVEAVNASHLIFVGEDVISLGRRERAFATNVDYVMLNNDSWTNPIIWGSSTAGYDAVRQKEGITVVACADTIFETLPVFIRDDMQLMKQYDGFSLYLLGNNQFDFATAYPKNQQMAVDYPYTAGYGVMNADFSDQGTLISNGTAGTVLYGPYTAGVEGEWNVSLQYEILDSKDPADAACFIIQKDGGATIMDSAIITPGQNEVVCEGLKLSDDQSGIEHVVTVPEGMIIEIKSITMQRVK